jgi:hypothetical protein
MPDIRSLRSGANFRQVPAFNTPLQVEDTRRGTVLPFVFGERDLRSQQWGGERSPNEGDEKPKCSFFKGAHWSRTTIIASIAPVPPSLSTCRIFGFRIVEARANDVSVFRRLRAVGKRQFSLMPDSRATSSIRIQASMDDSIAARSLFLEPFGRPAPFLLAPLSTLRWMMAWPAF